METVDNNTYKIVKEFVNKDNLSTIRFSNLILNNYIFNDEKVEIPLIALRIIFNIINQVRSEIFIAKDSEDLVKKFERTFENESFLYVKFRIHNKEISPSGSTTQIKSAMAFLYNFRQGYYPIVNSEHKKVESFGGLISQIHYDNCGFTEILVNSYWLRQLVVTTSYNPVIYSLAFKVTNNKTVLFALWLTQIRKEFKTEIYLKNINQKFGVNYKNINDLCSKFLKPIKISLDQKYFVSFTYKYIRDKVIIYPKIVDFKESQEVSAQQMEFRLNYFVKRYKLKNGGYELLIEHFRSSQINRDLIDDAYNSFIKHCRKNGEKATQYLGNQFLIQLQKFIKNEYQKTYTGKIQPEAYPRIY